jgi:hypothetical protein
VSREGLVRGINAGFTIAALLWLLVAVLAVAGRALGWL